MPTLTPTQSQAIRALLTHRSIRSAASTVGVNERTLRRWMQNPEFRFQVEQSQRDALSEVTASLQASAAAAVECLTAIVGRPSADSHVRVAASRTLLEYAYGATTRNYILRELERPSPIPVQTLPADPETPGNARIHPHTKGGSMPS